MSLFDRGGAPQSSLAELAELTKAHPDLAAEDAPPADAGTATETAPAAAPPERPTEAAPPPSTAVPPGAQGDGNVPPGTPPDKPPEGQDKAQDAEPADPKHGRPVPAAALAEARQKAREAEAGRAADRQAFEQQLQQLQGQLQAITQMVRPQQPQQSQAPAQPEDPAPDPNEDPMAFMAWQGRENQRLQQRLGQVVGFIQQQAVTQNIERAYQSDTARFMQTQADFPAAYAHLFTTRVAELRAQGYQDQQIAQQVHAEEMHIVATALRNNRSPAQVAYELAKSRGYVAAVAKPPETPAAQAAPAAPPASPQPRNPDGTFAAAPPDPALQEARRRAAASIAEGGTPPPPGNRSLEDIAKLQGSEFDKAFDELNRANRRSTLFRSN